MCCVPHSPVFGPAPVPKKTTRLSIYGCPFLHTGADDAAGEVGLGSVTATVAIAVAVVTVVPGDSLAAFVIGFAVLGGVLAGGALTFAAILLRGERALSVYAAALVLCGGVLFVLLHSLFISD